MTTEYPKTPELDKMKAVRDESQAQGMLLDWLSEKGLILCEWMEWEDAPAGYTPTQQRIESILAKYHEIDLNKCEDERRAVLEYVRITSA